MTSVKQWELCDGCALGKQTRVSYMKSSPNRAKQVLEVVHSDVCGPMQTPTFGGKRYFVTFIDDKSHFCVVYLLRNKSEVAAKFAEFVAFAETQTGKRVQTLRSDNGGEYTSRAMTKFCADRGIVQKFTPPYTPQLNGVAKRMNRTLVECARCMLEHAGLPKTYWGEAVMTATFLRNRCPTRAVSHDKSPHQVWTGKKPLLANLKVFGCHAYVHVPKAKRTKFDARSVRCRFLGYSEHEKAYRFEELESSRVLVSRDAQFMEDVFDSGRRDYHQREVVVIQDEETTDQDSSQSGEDDNEEEEEEEAARDEDFGPGNKRHPRTQSLEEVTEPFIRYHFVREKVEDGQVVLQYVSTTDMLADMMTKAITAVQFQVLRSKLGIQGAIAVESSGSVVKKAPRAAAVYRADSLSWELVTSRLLHEDNKRKGRPVKKTGACHNCGKQGHWIAECPSRVHNDAERYRSQRANVAQDEEDPGDYLFSVGRTSSTAKPSDMWLVDSGATQHMTSSNKYMRNYKKMAPVDVHLADD
uniref:Integrase catalytic domain-containing protein n=1 Tax=Phytophthora ramorum TaxID=164328 RepID=H3H9F8_PHYRM